MNADVASRAEAHLLAAECGRRAISIRSLAFVGGSEFLLVSPHLGLPLVAESAGFLDGSGCHSAGHLIYPGVIDMDIIIRV